MTPNIRKLAEAIVNQPLANPAQLALLAPTIAKALLKCIEVIEYYCDEDLYYEPDAKIDGGKRARKALEEIGAIE